MNALEIFCCLALDAWKCCLNRFFNANRSSLMAPPVSMIGGNNLVPSFDDLHSSCLCRCRSTRRAPFCLMEVCSDAMGKWGCTSSCRLLALLNSSRSRYNVSSVLVVFCCEERYLLRFLGHNLVRQGCGRFSQIQSAISFR